MAWPAIAAAVAGAALPAIAQFAGAKYQADRSNEMADEANRFTERMSSTAHQRQVADLKAAGLNPILSATQGGSSSPSAAMGTVSAPQVGQSLNATSAAQLQLLNAQTRNFNQDTILKTSQTMNTSDYLATQRMSRLLSEAQMANLASLTAGTNINNLRNRALYEAEQATPGYYPARVRTDLDTSEKGGTILLDLLNRLRSK